MAERFIPSTVKPIFLKAGWPTAPTLLQVDHEAMIRDTYGPIIQRCGRLFANQRHFERWVKQGGPFEMSDEQNTIAEARAAQRRGIDKRAADMAESVHVDPADQIEFGPGLRIQQDGVYVGDKKIMGPAPSLLLNLS